MRSSQILDVFPMLSLSEYSQTKNEYILYDSIYITFWKDKTKKTDQPLLIVIGYSGGQKQR